MITNNIKLPFVFLFSGFLIFLTIVGYVLLRPSDTFFWSLIEINGYIKAYWFNNVPSFVFSFSFTLMSLVLFKKNEVTLVFIWLVWAISLELSQIAESLSIHYFAFFTNYMNHGTFDKYDVLANVFGSALAYSIYVFTQKNRYLNEK